MQPSDFVRRLAEWIRDGGVGPVSHLIVEEIWLAVVEGALDVGERLPTPRQLAIALAVSPRSIERAYAELERRGVTVTRQGAGTFVSLAPDSEGDRARQQQFADLCADTVERARKLGFGVHDLIEALAEFRNTPKQERDS